MQEMIRDRAQAKAIQQKKGEGVRQKIEKALAISPTFQGLRYEKMAYSRSQAMYVLFLCSDRFVGMNEILRMTKLMKKQLGMEKLRLVVRQPADALEDGELLAQVVQEFMVASEPALLPFVGQSEAIFEGRFIDIAFARELAPEMVRRLGVDVRLEKYLLETFGREWKVRELSCSTGKLKESKVTAEIFQKIVEEEQRETLPVPKAPVRVERQVKKEAPAESVKKSAIAKSEIREPVQRMDSLLPDTQIVVEGDVISCETKVIQEGKGTFLFFDITDYTSSIRCKKYYKGDHAGMEHELEGERLRVKGEYIFDTYAKEHILNVRGIMPVAKTETVDTADEKRVELHLHTNMSAQDGISSVTDYIKQAAKWGHKAIAVTDHGVVQAFPEAAGAAAKAGIKIIYGMEAYMIDDYKKIYEGKNDHTFADDFVVFDIETTGLKPGVSEIIEIGAARIRAGKIVDEFQTFVKPVMGIPYQIISLTGISPDMVADAPDARTALEAFWKFAGTDCLVAHNADFDTSFVFGKSRELGMPCDNDVLDTLALARMHLDHLKTHKLDRIANHYGLTFNHHRASDDAVVTAKILLKMFSEMEQKDIHTLKGLNYGGSASAMKTQVRPYHTILLCKNKTGLINLYKLVSHGHLDFFKGRPRIPKSYIAKYREGLMVGSACEQGELYKAVLAGQEQVKLEEIASFYDYLEIQPNGNNAFMIREGVVKDEQELCDINRKIYELGRRLGKMTCATTDCHFLQPKDEYFRRILMDGIGFKDADDQAPLYFKTTDEMLGEFSYLGEQTAREVVIENPNKIADLVEHIDLFPGETAMPVVDGADQDILERAYKKMKELYGDPLPENIEKRLERELGSIIKHGFSVLYWIAMKLVEKSMSDGYLVGSRGSVGSSLAAFATGITEVNPLPPHYRCPKCKYSDFNIDAEEFGCGVDMPDAYCPKCGEKYVADGYDIPFEVFLGFNADKVPDIDLNFSGDYQGHAHDFIRELFGEKYVYRAGTISAIQENTAIGFVKKYMEKREKTVSGAELLRLARGLTGVKSTTGQHPGGLVIVPRDREIYEFTAIQKPANKMDVDTITTHFDFNSMHDILVKLDILGHDNPTIIRMLQDLIGFDPLQIPLDDPETLSLFSSTQALGITPEQIRGIKVGTFGIPEFGTKPTQKVLYKTNPTTMAELVRISGLTHGTDVWKGNAEDLIDSGTATLKSVICTRDDIMNHLVYKGVEQLTAFKIMESVRKGKWAKGKEPDQEKYEQAMRAANVEEWFIDSCRKIKYMFPKAHAVAYVVMALRIAYCKVHYPKEFYATIFSAKCGEFDATYVMGGVAAINAELDRLDELGLKASQTEKSLKVILELANEMLARGINFLPVDLKKSKAKKFVVEGDNIRLPFLAIPKLGEKAAELLEKEAAEEDFLSIEELKRRCKLSASVIDTMKEMGCLSGLSEKAQLTIFDVMQGMA